MGNNYYINISNYGTSLPAKAKPLWKCEDCAEDTIIKYIDIIICLRKLPAIEREIIEFINQGYTEYEIARYKRLSQPRIHKIKIDAFNHLKELLSTGVKATTG